MVTTNSSNTRSQQTLLKEQHWGCSGEAPVRFSKLCLKGAHWGCGGEAPLRESEHCLVLGLVRLGLVWLG
jgi:hypothetical protein